MPSSSPTIPISGAAPGFLSPAWFAQRPAFLAFVLACTAFALYSVTLTYPFVSFDDNVYVYENAMVREGLQFKTILLSFQSVEGANWHPMVWFSLLLDSSIGNGNAWAFHLSSITLHAANAALLFIAMRMMTAETWPSFLVALFWAVHPLRAESVAWVSERKDVLSGFFFFLTLIAYAHYVRQKSWQRYALVMFAFLLGLMSKAMLVTVPCVLFLLDVWPLGRPRAESGETWRSIILEKVLMLPLIIALSIVTFMVQSNEGAMNAGIAFPQRIINAFCAYAAYLGMTLWPADLAVLYPYGERELGLTNLILPVIVLTAVTALAAWAWRRNHKYLMIGWLWYLGMLVPVIGLIQVGGQYMADRYTYLPIIGVLIALVWGLRDAAAVAPSPIRAVAHAAALAAAFALAFITFTPTLGYWKDSTSLWNQAVKVSPDSPWPHGMLAAVKLNERSYIEAQAHAAIATQKAPNLWYGHYLLGYALSEQQKPAMALSHAAKACELAPDKPLAWMVYGLTLEKLGHIPQALAAYEQGMAVRRGANPWLIEYYYGNLLSNLNRHAQAVECFQKVSEQVYHMPSVTYSLAFSLAELGRDDEARKQYIALLGYNSPPQTAEIAWTYNGLGILETRAGRWQSAADYFSKALELNPNDAIALGNLASMQERLGKRQEAAATLHKVLKIAPADADAKAALARLGYVPTP